MKTVTSNIENFSGPPASGIKVQAETWEVRNNADDVSLRLVDDGAGNRTATINGTLNVVGGIQSNGVTGYKIARSAAPVALDGSNPTSVAHGLTTCLAAFVQLVGSAAPGVGTSVLTEVINGANIDVYAWKPTSSANPTLIASTGTETFNWFAVGI